MRVFRVKLTEKQIARIEGQLDESFDELQDRGNEKSGQYIIVSQVVIPDRSNGYQSPTLEGTIVTGDRSVAVTHSLQNAMGDHDGEE